MIYKKSLCTQWKLFYVMETYKLYLLHVVCSIVSCMLIINLNNKIIWNLRLHYLHMKISIAIVGFLLHLPTRSEGVFWVFLLKYCFSSLPKIYQEICLLSRKHHSSSINCHSNKLVALYSVFNLWQVSMLIL